MTNRRRKQAPTGLEDELKILAEEMRSGLPNPKWMGELMWMVSHDKVSQQNSIKVMEHYIKKRREVWEQVVALLP